jgi:hypothetical protein
VKADLSRVRVARKHIGFVYSKDKESEPVVIDHTTTVTVTEAPGTLDQAILPSYANIVFGGNQVDILKVAFQPIPSLYKDIVFSGEDSNKRQRLD